MQVRLDAERRYDMPASFGPSAVPDRTVVDGARALVLTTHTRREAVEPLVPAHFSVPDRPTLTVAHMHYPDVDYLGGRSYNEIVVSVGAQFGAAGGRIDAALAVLLWVDQAGALIAGREYMGFPKLAARISDLDEAMRFTCAEYDEAIVEGAARTLSPMGDEQLERLNARAGEVRTFGWKYIAAAGGGSDVDQPLINVMRWRYDQAWTGEGEFRFIPAAFADAPMSANAVNALAALPHEGPVRAFRGIGQATIDRTATRRLERP